MTTDQAIALLTEHRNGIQSYSYSERKEALGVLRPLVTEWIQRVDGFWQLVILGFHD